MTVRAFLGISLAPHVRTLLSGCADAIRDAAPEWRGEKWVPAENLHVTLQFLGMVPETATEDVLAAVYAVCDKTGEFPFSVSAVEAVPRPRSTSMLWARSSDDPTEMTELAHRIASGLAPLGYERERRPFTPHITLVRARQPKPMGFEPLDVASRCLYTAGERDKRMSVRGITVYSSTLTPHGAHYEEIAFVPFAGD